MKYIKSHFLYSRSQRNGIFLLVLIVIVLQGGLLFFNNFQNNSVVISSVSKELQSQLDSVLLMNQTKELKIYPFNPNYLSDYKAYQLGMSIEEIDRLMTFRSTGKYINSTSDFKKVTQVSDSLLNNIAPYFKFPDWVTKKKSIVKEKIVDVFVVKDINTASLEELMKVKGIGEKRASSIIKYRTLLGGYTYDTQLKEVWGIPPEVLEQFQKEFQVLSKPRIDKININTATAYQLSRVVYIDSKLAESIIEYRKEVAEIQNLAELKIIRDFPEDKFNLISLYLHAY
ncbi:ComEA family DNA-binding protein [Wenyingzhuangia marina]|uniref:Competence protein ComEA helix-hairpin-helix repeat region n=1 Tax=Wenyingzhuangia marina TaxID=1195760 RepID=A0A1M5VVR0_9FLAO|nr:helix-hairpin-helix domain-containing protein [Wenyingzhuangia marina]SHH79326.1 competence protein ComEA helix-hairpin-helix repeat region [Wenyingzhuangia marina]